jgi:hypothetical protein
MLSVEGFGIIPPPNTPALDVIKSSGIGWCNNITDPDLLDE